MSRKTRHQAGEAAPPVGQTPGGAPRRATRRRAILVGTGAATLLAVAGGAYLLAGGASGPGGSRATRPGLRSEHAPALGEPSARVHIVEFIDPACETCAVFYPLVKQLMAENPGRIRLSMRHVPFHKGADEVVRYLEASRRQDRYWQVLEALLAAQPHWAPNHTARADLALPVIASVGLNLQQLMADRSLPEIAERMRRDMDDAATLGVTKTPEYFVNGRQMPSFGRQQLQALVRDEVRNAY